MRPPKITRTEAVIRIADVFRRLGYEGATLTDLSAATGLGRASLYHHFPGGKEDMAREVFRWLNESVERELIAPVHGPGRPAERLARWASGVERIYLGGEKNCVLAAMTLGGGSERFARELDWAFHAQIGALAALGRDAGIPRKEARRRAENAIGRIQGALILARGLRDVGHFGRVLREVQDELLAPA